MLDRRSKLNHRSAKASSRTEFRLRQTVERLENSRSHCYLSEVVVENEAVDVVREAAVVVADFGVKVGLVEI